MKYFSISIDFRRIFTILLVISGLYLFTLNWNMRNRKFSEDNLNLTMLIENKGLILNTAGCNIPKFDPYDKSIRRLISTRKPYICRGKPIPIATQPNGSIVLNELILKNFYNISAKSVSCFYYPILRKPMTNQIRENSFAFGKRRKIQFGVPVDDDLLYVKCRLGKRTIKLYLPLAPLKPDVEKEKSFKDHNSAYELNVILVGIDSVSKLNFLRQFKRTYSFLLENLFPLDLRGYTKVGDNTFPNLVPLLTGHFVQSYWSENLRNIMFFDDIDLIWKKYSEMGYRTFYAEDSPLTGTFNFNKRGFLNPPTDYYYRPLALAIEYSKLRRKNPSYCIDSRLEVDVIYKYLEDFVATMDYRPFFAFAMVSIMTHDNLNDAGYADEPTYRLLKHLLENDILNKSLLVFFSDHGIRFGPIRQTYLGKYEERMPFMFLNFPQWFLKKYPNFALNLRKNQNRLTTPFDIHATLIHLLKINGQISEVESMGPSLGLSLLGEITLYRTCEDANILPHWCPCQVYKYVSVHDPLVVKSANAVINAINSKTETYRNVCSILELHTVLDARKGEANDEVQRFLNHKNVVIDEEVIYGPKVKALTDYLVTLIAKPSEGVFEATVRHYENTRNFEVQGISRINIYGEQSNCIESPILKKFCFCLPPIV